MKVVYNSIIPFKGFTAITFGGLCFVRKGSRFNERVMNHESIHQRQQREMLYLPFFIVYLAEWAARLLFSSPREAYRNISFEREAYANESDYNYLSNRKPYSWLHYFSKPCT